MEQAFDRNGQAYFDFLHRMGYGKPDSLASVQGLKPADIVIPADKEWETNTLAWESIGYEQAIAPIQLLTFYNAVANGGKIVRPTLYEDSTTVILPQIAARASIDSLQRAMLLNVSEGLGRSAASEKVQVAGLQGSIDLTTNEEYPKGIRKYAVEFCGYFPADTPKYTVIISMSKENLPASGGLMAGGLFKKIVELIALKHYPTCT